MLARDGRVDLPEWFKPVQPAWTSRNLCSAWTFLSTPQLIRARHATPSLRLHPSLYARRGGTEVIGAAQRMHVRPDQLFAVGAISSDPQLSSYLCVFTREAEQVGWSSWRYLFRFGALVQCKKSPLAGVSTATRISDASKAYLISTYWNAIISMWTPGPLFACAKTMRGSRLASVNSKIRHAWNRRVRKLLCITLAKRENCIV